MDFHWAIRLCFGVVAGLVHVRLFVIYHDHQHGAIFEGSKLVDIFFRCYGLLTLSPSSIWKHTHDDHHINNARSFRLEIVGTYPILTTEAYQKLDRGKRLVYHISRHPLTILFGYLTVFFYGFCLRPLLVDPRRHLDGLAAIVLHVGLLVALGLTRLDILGFAVLLPWFVATGFGSYLFYAQHNFPGVQFRSDEDWDYVYAALRSSSFMKMNPVLHWFTANIGYHHVHHLNSRIPFYRLPETMAAFKELQSPGTTTLWPKDVLHCLRLNLWDNSRDRFVSFRENRRMYRKLQRVGS